MLKTYSFKILQLIYLFLIPIIVLLFFNYEGIAESGFLLIYAIIFGIIQSIFAPEDKQLKSARYKMQSHVKPKGIKIQKKVNSSNDNEIYKKMLKCIDTSIKN